MLYNFKWFIISNGLHFKDVYNFKWFWFQMVYIFRWFIISSGFIILNALYFQMVYNFQWFIISSGLWFQMVSKNLNWSNFSWFETCEAASVAKGVTLNRISMFTFFSFFFWGCGIYISNTHILGDEQNVLKQQRVVHLANLELMN